MIKVTARDIANEYGVSEITVRRYAQKNKALKDKAGFFQMIRKFEARALRKESANS